MERNYIINIESMSARFMDYDLAKGIEFAEWIKSPEHLAALNDIVDEVYPYKSTDLYPEQKENVQPLIKNVSARDFNNGTEEETENFYFRYPQDYTQKRDAAFKKAGEKLVAEKRAKMGETEDGTKNLYDINYVVSETLGINSNDSIKLLRKMLKMKNPDIQKQLTNGSLSLDKIMELFDINSNPVRHEKFQKLYRKTSEARLKKEEPDFLGKVYDKGLGLCGHVSNNPIMKIDPAGLSERDEWNADAAFLTGDSTPQEFSDYLAGGDIPDRFNFCGPEQPEGGNSSLASDDVDNINQSETNKKIRRNKQSKDTESLIQKIGLSGAFIGGGAGAERIIEKNKFTITTKGKTEKVVTGIIKTKGVKELTKIAPKIARGTMVLGVAVSGYNVYQDVKRSKKNKLAKGIISGVGEGLVITAGVLGGIAGVGLGFVGAGALALLASAAASHAVEKGKKYIFKKLDE